MRSTVLKGMVLVVALAAAGACGKSMQPASASAAPSDDTLGVRVKTSIMNTPAVHANEVNVAVDGGVVTLSGVVHNQEEIDSAVSAARKVEGVRDVNVQLQIKQ